jgi:hypothetical protein
MWYHVAAGTLAWGTAKKATEPYTPWYFDVGTDAAVVYLSLWDKTRPFMTSTARTTGRGIHALGRHGARAAVRTGGRIAATRVAAHSRWVAGTAALYTASVAVGYSIGAVVGTAVSGQLFGPRGTKLALDFYTGQGKYGEYFDIVGNFNTVFNALKQGDI